MEANARAKEDGTETCTADLTVERMYRALPHPQRPIAMFLVSWVHVLLEEPWKQQDQRP